MMAQVPETNAKLPVLIVKSMSPYFIGQSSPSRCRFKGRGHCHHLSRGSILHTLQPSLICHQSQFIDRNNLSPGIFVLFQAMPNRNLISPVLQNNCGANTLGSIFKPFEEVYIIWWSRCKQNKMILPLISIRNENNIPVLSPVWVIEIILP